METAACFSGLGLYAYNTHGVHRNTQILRRMDKLAELNSKVVNIGHMEIPDFAKNVLRAPLVERMVAEMFQIFIATPVQCGSVDVDKELEAGYLY